uniref:PGG domain-containing protein n=1 Tax=Aegilops tauschii subsp. strangulata TaxID=200361 RepID=A0A453RDB6_AEGTS
ELDSQRAQQQDAELDSQRIREQDTELDSLTTHQQATEHVVRDTEAEGVMSNLQCYSADRNLVSTGDVRSVSTSDLDSMEDIMPTTLRQSHDQSEHAAIKVVCSSSTDALTTEEVPSDNLEIQPAGGQQVAIPMALSSSDSRNSIQGTLPLQGSVDENATSGNLRIDADDPAMGCELPDNHGDSTEQHAQQMSNNPTSADDRDVRLEIDNTANDQAPQHQRCIKCSCRNPDDAFLKKSRTYLLLLAILAVSLTYQAGLNPPGGFWTSNATNKHSAGDPILEDNYHKRYLAFFYFNATAFAASLVMILMLLSRKMSNKVIKRRRMKFAPPQTDNESRDAKEKDLARRRNLLFILAILAATVTYQAGLNPPGGIWPDENSKGGKPGNPVLQDSHPERYNVFYYSNAVSFASSVAVIILLVNRESCEDGIKSYAIRVCLVAGLLGLLIAYSAGTCRKARPVIYLIVIASAALTCLVIQVLVLQDALDGPLTWLRGRLREILHLEPDSETPLESSDEENKERNAQGSGPLISEKKEKKRQKYLMLLSVLAASIAYQAGLNPPGGFWPDDTPKNGYKAGNPVLKDINSWRYMVFYVFNSISFMSSIAVVMLLLSKSVRQKVPLQALHFIMILDLLALMTAYAAGSCRKFRTSIFILVVVCCVLVYLLFIIILSSRIARWLKKQKNKVASLLLEP